MPFVHLPHTPSLPPSLLEDQPTEIFYRDYYQGKNIPIIFLHSGWGYQIYPFDKQIDYFGAQHRIIIADRTGYGRSTHFEEFQNHFHHCAAIEMLAFLDALKIERSILWGHSDGAMISAIMALLQPAKFAGIILEAFHYDRAKPSSREFFDIVAHNPDHFGEKICNILAQDHGQDYWRRLIKATGRAWQNILAHSHDINEDFYNNRLDKLSVPAIFIHGEKDKRTEPDELSKVQQLLPHVKINIIANGGHSPHSNEPFANICNQIAAEFIDKQIIK